MFSKNTRYRLAFSFGRKEHFFSRLLFVTLLATVGVYYAAEYNFLGVDWFSVLKYWLWVDVALWVLYWICHRLEKLAHPNH